MRPILPEKVYSRQDKVGFQTPLAKWITGQGREWSESKLDQVNRVFEGRLAERFPKRFKELLSSESGEWGYLRRLMDLMTFGECIEQIRSVERDTRTTLKCH